MSQTNKDDIKATVNQTKTAFGANDLSNENQTATTTGTVSAKDLTAGSWNGKFYFNVNLNEPNAYYSTLAKAVQDINDNAIDTDTSVADLQTSQDATCGVYKESNDVYRIEIYKDIDNQESITINKNVKIDLNDHTITFADSNGINSTNDLSIYDGIINTTNVINSINISESPNAFILDNIKINSTGTNNTYISSVETDALNTKISNSIFNTHGTNVKSNGIINNGGTINLTNSTIDVYAEGENSINKSVGINTTSETSVLNLLKNVTITVRVDDKQTGKTSAGIRVSKGTVNSYDCNIYSPIKNTPSKLLH